MSLQSDLVLNVSKLRPEAVSESEKKLNDAVVTITEKGPQWFEVGAAKYREMRENGQTVLPKRAQLEEAKQFCVPSREKGRDVPCRLIKPDHRGKVQGVFMHIHGGGWVLTTEKDQDPFLKKIANTTNVAVVSIGYRLAPEHPFPRGPEDCYDAAEWLVDNAQSELGAPVMFAGGESAGAHLTTLTTFHLLKTRPTFAFNALILNFGVFDLSMLPLLRNIKRPLAVINSKTVREFVNVFLPGKSPEECRDPTISPLYADLNSMELPSALFLCGTEDCLLEDTIMMATRWQMAGAEAVTRLFPGAPHGFLAFSPDQSVSAKEGMEIIKEFLKAKIGG